MTQAFGGAGLVELAHRTARPAYVVACELDGTLGLADRPGPGVVGTLPPIYPEWLGSRDFTAAHGVRFPYVAGEMAKGIAGTALVETMARAEMLAFFGAAGLPPGTVDDAAARLRADLGQRDNWGVNLIHCPDDPELEDRIVTCILHHRVPKVSLSAFMDITPAVVRCAASGLRVDRVGRVVRPVSIFAKVSRAEVADIFFDPPPMHLVRQLVDKGVITGDEARLSQRIPIADDITVEADSGGHTDNRPLVSSLPSVLRRGRERKSDVRIGAAGGLGDPSAVAAAFALGAAYVVTGTVNQMSVEAAISAEAKAMLADASPTDVAMAPSADMFELGVKVQVLRRGTMFASKAARLHRLYTDHGSLEELSRSSLDALERDILGATVDAVWQQTKTFWAERDPTQIERSERDPRHRMALTFRWYLGNSTDWAVKGTPSRRTDFQLWASPAAGAFNAWSAGSLLADPAQRTVTQIARNLLQGAAVLTRVHQLRACGLRLPAEAFHFRPRRLA